MEESVNESSPLSGGRQGRLRPRAHHDRHESTDTNVLLPIPRPIPISARVSSVIKMILKVPVGIVGGMVALFAFAILTLTGIGPIIEMYLSKRDARVLDRDKILRDHPEMFLLEIPANINKASLGRSL